MPQDWPSIGKTKYLGYQSILYLSSPLPPSPRLSSFSLRPLAIRRASQPNFPPHPPSLSIFLQSYLFPTTKIDLLFIMGICGMGMCGSRRLRDDDSSGTGEYAPDPDAVYRNPDGTRWVPSAAWRRGDGGDTDHDAIRQHRRHFYGTTYVGVKEHSRNMQRRREAMVKRKPWKSESDTEALWEDVVRPPKALHVNPKWNRTVVGIYGSQTGG